MAKGDRWSDDGDVKVREMRNAETVLGVIREREFSAETTGELLEIERLTSGSELDFCPLLSVKKPEPGRGAAGIGRAAGVFRGAPGTRGLQKPIPPTANALRP